MHKFAVLIGIYSYSLFTLGILGRLGKLELSIVTALFLIGLVGVVRKVGEVRWKIKLGGFEKLVVFLILLQIIVNLIGTLGPELAFDSLWYHLTIPKIWLENGSIFHIPGGLFYYSDMPKLIEMLYIPGLAFGNEIFAKLIHFGFGIGCLLAIYKLARRFVSIKLSLLACLIFYSNLVVGWLSITSFVDLSRSFFEILALYYFVDYIKIKKTKLLLISALMVGFAITTKLLAFGSLIVFLVLIFRYFKSLSKTILFSLAALFIPLPWFIFAYINTRNPIYPIFADVDLPKISFDFTNFINFIHSADPISPIYLIFLPLIIVLFGRLKPLQKLIGLYALISFIVWYFTPQSGGGRFITAYLPVYSVLTVFVFELIKHKLLKNYLISIILLISIMSVIYRGAANAKYVPVVLGFESKDKFLTRNLNFSFGDFYDTDGYFAKNIKASDRVLIYGFHNLYYVNFSFIHESYLQPEDKFNYILTRNSEIPQKFENWKKVYENKTTFVKLYKKP